jgi:outer membrane biosynthesis protein TonB
MTEYIERFFTAVERIAGALEVIAGNCCQQPTVTTTVKDVTPDPEPEPPKKKRAPRKKKAAEPAETPAETPVEEPPAKAPTQEDVRAAAKALLEHYQADGDTPDDARTKALTVIGESCKKFKTTIADIPEKEYATVIAALEAAKNA